MASMVSDKKPTVKMIEDPCARRVTSLLLLSGLSLYLVFDSLIKMCLRVDLIEYLQFVELFGCAGSCLSSNLGSFKKSLFLQIFSVPLSLPSLYSTPIIHLLVHLMVSHRFCGIYLFSFILSCPDLQNG